MTLTAARFDAALEAWFVYSESEPGHAERLMRQNAHFLVDRTRVPGFHPIRFILAHVSGVPFQQAGGRSINMAKWTGPLRAIGLTDHDETAAKFDTIYNGWHAACLTTGKPICRYVGPDPRTGRVFWLRP